MDICSGHGSTVVLGEGIKISLTKKTHLTEHGHTTLFCEIIPFYLSLRKDPFPCVRVQRDKTLLRMDMASPRIIVRKGMLSDSSIFAFTVTEIAVCIY